MRKRSTWWLENSSFQEGNTHYPVDNSLCKSYYPCQSPFWKLIKVCQTVLQLWIERSMDARQQSQHGNRINRPGVYTVCKWLQQSVRLTQALKLQASFYFYWKVCILFKRKGNKEKFYEKVIMGADSWTVSFQKVTLLKHKGRGIASFIWWPSWVISVLIIMKNPEIAENLIQ